MDAGRSRVNPSGHSRKTAQEVYRWWNDTATEWFLRHSNEVGLHASMHSGTPEHPAWSPLLGERGIGKFILE